MSKKTDKKTSNEQDYHVQQDHNKAVFKRMIKDLNPELFVLVDLLDETGVSPMILYKTIRALYNVSIGTGYGNVSLIIEKGRVRFVKSEELDKIEEPIIKQTLP